MTIKMVYSLNTMVLVMSVCRRNATTQISGEGEVTFRSGTVTGVNTKYTKQLSLNDNIVIKGQTYVVTKITSDTNISILPTYRGVSNSGVVITKVMTTKVPQTQWNIDKCDGTGPSGFNLNPARIQMAYMDYSWYGAGKVRFGFKDNHGKVFYVHEFIITMYSVKPIYVLESSRWYEMRMSEPKFCPCSRALGYLLLWMVGLTQIMHINLQLVHRIFRLLVLIQLL